MKLFASTSNFVKAVVEPEVHNISCSMHKNTSTKSEH